jgi:hypothetical protein
MSSVKLELVQELLNNAKQLDRLINAFSRKFKFKKLKTNKKLKFLSEISDIKYDKLKINDMFIDRLW